MGGIARDAVLVLGAAGYLLAVVDLIRLGREEVRR